MKMRSVTLSAMPAKAQPTTCSTSKSRKNTGVPRLTAPSRAAVKRNSRPGTSGARAGGSDRPSKLRCADLPAALRGTPSARKGVVAKAPKPIQERRVDMPVIGPQTVELAAAAGLAGVAGEAGGVLILDRPATIAAADRLGLFVVGVAP